MAYQCIRMSSVPVSDPLMHDGPMSGRSTLDATCALSGNIRVFWPRKDRRTYYDRRNTTWSRLPSCNEFPWQALENWSMSNYLELCKEVSARLSMVILSKYIIGEIQAIVPYH